MTLLQLTSRSPQETQRLGRLLGRLAQPGDIFLLTGGLGVGKTTLTQGIAWGAGVQEPARSPTFVMVAQYRGRIPIYHLDLYRIEDPLEALDLGLDEYLSGNGLCVIEWAEKVPQVFPPEHLLVRMEHVDECTRRLGLEARGERYQSLLNAVAKAAEADTWN